LVQAGKAPLAAVPAGLPGLAVAAGRNPKNCRTARLAVELASLTMAEPVVSLPSNLRADTPAAKERSKEKPAKERTPPPANSAVHRSNPGPSRPQQAALRQEDTAPIGRPGYLLAIWIRKASLLSV
jgi:hypothetical protein